jgi:hypothetical protein
MAGRSSMGSDESEPVFHRDDARPNRTDYNLKTMSVFISMLYAAFGVGVAELLLQGIIRILGEEAAKLHYLAISLAVFFVISVMFLALSERGVEVAIAVGCRAQTYGVESTLSSFVRLDYGG